MTKKEMKLKLEELRGVQKELSILLGAKYVESIMPSAFGYQKIYEWHRIISKVAKLTENK